MSDKDSAEGKPGAGRQTAGGTASAIGIAASGWAWLTHSSQRSSEGWKCAATWLTSAMWLTVTSKASNKRRKRTERIITLFYCNF
jgi:hypothetical protein